MVLPTLQVIVLLTLQVIALLKDGWLCLHYRLCWAWMALLTLQVMLGMDGLPTLQVIVLLKDGWLCLHYRLCWAWRALGFNH